MVLSYSAERKIQVAAASGATFMASLFLAIVWDYFGVNNWLFPTLGSWSWRSWIEASGCFTIIFVTLIVIALKDFGSIIIDK